MASSKRNTCIKVYVMVVRTSAHGGTSNVHIHPPTTHNRFLPNDSPSYLYTHRRLRTHGRRRVTRPPRAPPQEEVWPSPRVGGVPHLPWDNKIRTCRTGYIKCII